MQAGNLWTRPHHVKVLYSCNSRDQRRYVACTASNSRRNADLLTVLGEAARRQTLPWLQDILIPVIGINGPNAPPELGETVSARQLADPDSKFITVKGVQLHYKEYNPTPSPPTKQRTILLVHGFNGSTFSWRANGQAIATATGHRVIAYDRPPFGLSGRPLEWGPGKTLDFNPYDLNGGLQLLEGFVDAMGISGPIVAVGHSAGAQIAVELLRRRPSQVAALALVSPALPTTPKNSLMRRATFGSQLRFLVIRALLQSDVAGLRYVRRQLLQRRDEIIQGGLGFTPHPSTSSMMSTDVDEDQLGEVALQEAKDGYLKPLRAHYWDRAALLNLRAFNMPSSYDYDSFQVPVLIIQGRDDGALTDNARVLKELLQKRTSRGSITSYHELDCGHVPMDELPLDFNAILTDFLTSHAESL